MILITNVTVLRNGEIGCRGRTERPELVIDFDAALYRPLFEIFGQPAFYAPPAGGPSVPCTVIRNRADREFSLGTGKPVAGLSSCLIEAWSPDILPPHRA